MKTKLYLKQSDGSHKVFESSRTLEEAVAQWQWYHDPLNLMPCLQVATFVVLLPVMAIAFLLAAMLYPLKIANHLIGAIARFLNETCYKMLENHTHLSIKQ